MATMVSARADIGRVSQFLYEEAALLDQRRWFDWMDLFTDGAMYWVPLTPDQPDPINHVSIFYEDAMMREVRARRLEEQRALDVRRRVQPGREQEVTASQSAALLELGEQRFTHRRTVSRSWSRIPPPRGAGSRTAPSSCTGCCAACRSPAPSA